MEELERIVAKHSRKEISSAPMEVGNQSESNGPKQLFFFSFFCFEGRAVLSRTQTCSVPKQQRQFFFFFFFFQKTLSRTTLEDFAKVFECRHVRMFR